MKIPLLFPNKKILRLRGILLIFSFCLFNVLNAQTVDKITLNVENKPLSQVFLNITQQTGYRFSYSSQIIDMKRKISINIQHKSLDETLELLFWDTLSYKKMGKYVILSKKKDSNKNNSSDRDLLLEDGAENTFENTKTENNNLTDSKETFHSQKKVGSDNGIIQLNCHDTILTTKRKKKMKSLLTTISFLTLMTANNLPAQEITLADSVEQAKENMQDTTQEKKRAFQLSFVYPLGTSWIYSPKYIYNFSFNVIGGVTGKIKGAELAMVFYVNNYSVHGFQAAGVFNFTGINSQTENSSNVQFAGGFNFTKAGKSVQFAEGANIADTGCLQIAGGANISKKSYAQFAAGVNVTKDGVFQAAAGVNIASNSMAQISAGVNHTSKGKMQISAGVNIANVSTCQITAGVNITAKGRFQMGIINVRDTADGVSLGLINIVKHGGVLEAGIEGTEFIHSSITFRSGIQKLYTVLSTGWNYSDKFGSTGFGLGTAFLWKNRIGLNLELMHYNLYKINNSSYNGLVQFRPVFNIRIVNHFKMFLGPTANLLIQQEQSKMEVKLPYSLVSWNNRYTNLNFWTGIVGGLKF
ncbi:MAG: STN domain-containing protein [Bacteroidales bacterium]|jgi:hypothetical protein|nr:STN domain-containing protein [Bacteroidales bacterium]